MRMLLAMVVLGFAIGGGPFNTRAADAASKPPGFENFQQVSPRIYSGSGPEGEVAFAELQKRGIKTIISVDGAKPDVATAKKYGLQYVHLPIGYDGVPTNQAMKLVKAVESLPQPVFVHCHHGLHRGPASVATICMAVEKWTPEQAIAWMKSAGTGSNYTGLYKSVAEFHPPSAAELAKIPANFADKVDVSAMVDAMVEIDNRFDNLKLVKKAGYQQPPSHPDIAPAHEALLLQELFQELLRSPETAKHKPDFKTKLTEAHGLARDFQQLLASKKFTKEQADGVFQKMTNSCSSCHKAHRN